MTVFRDRVYAPGRKSLNKLDVYSPLRGKSHPVVVYVHGGSYISGDKLSSVFNKPESFTSHGFVFVSVDYQLSPSVCYPTHARDVADAVAWVRSSASRFGGDPQRIFLIGHSAGAQLVALIATDESFLKQVGMSSEI